MTQQRLHESAALPRGRGVSPRKGRHPLHYHCVIIIIFIPVSFSHGSVMLWCVQTETRGWEKTPETTNHTSDFCRTQTEVPSQKTQKSDVTFPPVILPSVLNLERIFQHVLVLDRRVVPSLINVTVKCQRCQIQLEMSPCCYESLAVTPSWHNGTDATRIKHICRYKTHFNLWSAACKLQPRELYFKSSWRFQSFQTHRIRQNVKMSKCQNVGLYFG